MTQKTRSPLGRSWSVALGFACVFALTACSQVVRNHGYTPTDVELEEVIVGVDTRDSLDVALGRPSTSGVLRDSAWYYVGSKVRQFGPTKPKEIERMVVAISFDGQGVVRNIERFGLERGQVVTLSRRVTETTKVQSTLVRQILRNFGRIDTSTITGN
ncbi:MAG: outer membrane protein assembly factor BamE [Litoreibacter sp.]